jgi:class 3 adenylate cyclase
MGRVFRRHWTACARQGCRKNERGPEARVDLVADVVGYSRLAGAHEERTLARLRALLSDLIDLSIALHHGALARNWRRRARLR